MLRIRTNLLNELRELIEKHQLLYDDRLADFSTDLDNTGSFLVNHMWKTSILTDKIKNENIY